MRASRLESVETFRSILKYKVINMSWRLQEAKHKFGKVVKEARRSGPQFISMRGKDAFVVLSMEDYERLAPKEDNLADFLLSSPLHDSGIEIEREPRFERDIEL